jgi:hypothetical protein
VRARGVRTGSEMYGCEEFRRKMFRVVVVSMYIR